MRRERERIRVRGRERESDRVLSCGFCVDTSDSEAVALFPMFEPSTAKLRHGRWMLIGGVGLVVVAVLGFLVAVFTTVGQVAMHLMSTVPMIIAVGLFAGARTFLRSPRCVVLTDDELMVDGRSGERAHRWREIGWVTVNASAMSQKRTLVIFDRSGRRLESLSEVLEPFDELVAEVKARVAEQPEPVAGDIQMRKARRGAIFTGLFSLAMLAAAGFVAWTTHDEQITARLLASDAVEGVATIDRLFVAPNGVTTRVEYTVTNEQGASGSRNTEIEPEYHAKLSADEATMIPVRFVPSRPDVSRLLHGELIEDDFTKTPLGGYGLAALATLLSLLAAGAAIIQWLGFDIDLDSKTGRISIKRFGEGV